MSKKRPYKGNTPHRSVTTTGRVPGSSPTAAVPTPQSPLSGQTTAEPPPIPLTANDSLPVEIAQVDGLLDRASNGASDDDLSAASEASVPPGVSPEQAIRRALEAELLFARRTELATAKIAEFEKRDDEAKTRAQEQETRQQRLDERETELTSLKEQLCERDLVLKERERAAEKGFREQKRHVLDGITEESDRLIELRTRAEASWEKQHDEIEKSLEERRQRLERDYLKRQADADKSYAERDLKFDEIDRELKDRQRQLLADRRILDAEKWENEDKRRGLDEAIEHRTATRLEEFEREKARLKVKLDVALASLASTNAKLDAREGADLRFGSRSPEQVLQELEASGEEIHRLRLELSTRPSPNLIDDNQRLQDELRAEQEEKKRLARIENELSTKLSRVNIECWKLEAVRDERLSIEIVRDSLTRSNIELKKEIDRLTKAKGSVAVFEACVQMDEDSKLQSPSKSPGKTAPSISLRDLVAYLRYFCAIRADKRDPLYYSEADLRSFLAGMAMSQLMLLQGISGIGKTSLPLRIASAMGGGWRKIEVQAGWRDKFDLFGYYNSFEGRFYEKPFLQAIYEAQCPAYKNRPYFIILDEMNLSHPEQYFADVLSGLGDAQQNPLLDILDVGVAQSPRLFVEDGAGGKRKLPMPKNVWFVGTANHDETTVSFAPKTYDRAYVLELPTEHSESTLERHELSDVPLSFEKLTAAFENAKKNQKGVAEDAADFLEALRKPLADLVGIGWGSRLKVQLGSYVPVVIDSGGKLCEALDYVLAFRLLRDLPLRQDLNLEKVISLEDRINKAWQKEPKLKNTSLDKTHQVLEKTRSNLGGSRE